MQYLCQLGTYNPITDAFGLLVNLNDGQTFEIMPNGIDLTPPSLDAYLSANARLHGLRISHTTQGERNILIQLVSGPAASYPALIAAIRSLLTLQDRIRLARLAAQAGLGSAPRICLKLQPPGSTEALYADILAMAHQIPGSGDVEAWVRLIQTGITLGFTCAPFLRGARVSLANDLNNPGFEAPSGPPATVFTDPFTNGNAYTLTGLGYNQVILADAPTIYYRLNELSGATVNDSSGHLYTATYFGTVGYGATGLAFGTDTAIGFDGTTTAVYGAIALTPTDITIEAWVKETGMGATQATIFMLTNGTWYINIKISDSVLFFEATGGIGNQFTLAGSYLNSVHHVALVYQGATGTTTFYLDGVQVGTGTTNTGGVSVNSIHLGNYSAKLKGTLDEVAVYSTALSATNIANHYRYGRTGAMQPTVAASVLSIPASATLQFGSNTWGPINLWQIRFQYPAGGAFQAIWHYTDILNYHYVLIDGGQVAYHHIVNGADHPQATSACALTGGTWYWLRISSFPAALPNVPPQITATVLNDAAGTPGAIFAGTGNVIAYNGTTALTGPCQLLVNAVGTLNIGGAYANTHTLALFGPGGWTFSNSGGTAKAAGAWDAAGGYTSAPIASAYAARVDLPPAGTVQADWQSCPAGQGASITQQQGIGITPGVATSASVWVKSSGLSGSAQVQLITQELDATGTLLRTGMTVSLTGNQAAWVQLTGSWTPGANAAYANSILRVVDLSAPAASANAIVWWDNGQCWPTGLGVTMPYCELRFPAAPAQMVLSGLLGDVPAPLFFAIGTLPSGGTLAAGGSLSLYAGRRAMASFSGRLVGSALIGAPNDGTNNLIVIDSAMYGGYRAHFQNAPASYAPFAITGAAGDLLGTYHLMLRAREGDANPTTQNLQAISYEVLHPWVGDGTKLDRPGIAQSPYGYPWAAQNTWTLADAGQLTLPSAPLPPLADPTQVLVTAVAQSTTLVGSMDVDWVALLPVEADTIALAFLNNNAGVTLPGWIWLYHDGLSHYATGQGSATWSLEPSATPNPAHAGGAPGSAVQGSPAVNPAGDSIAFIDPQVATSAAIGVNQWVIVLTDNAANVLPIAARVTYSPLWLNVR